MLLAFTCCQPTGESEGKFVQLSPTESGVDFVNAIEESDTLNYFTYPYIYMGGGVAIGDINQDGLQDLVFTSNMGVNRLYLNQGNMRFRDITQSAGVGESRVWHTGVTLADVNADGFLDIYVSVSGKWEGKANLLYINNQDLTFTERAAEFGLADEGHGTQATFFDYDRDGDLDAFVANYPPLHFKAPNFVYSQNLRNPKWETSDHLYRNEGGKFIDVTEEAGLLNFGLSLSATVGDLNQDGWMDLYVSNDFASPDFCYLNNGDGTFSNQLEAITNHTSFYGMGTDLADINNDGLLDLYQVDMTPADNYRAKANMASMNPEGFAQMVSLGLTHQYMENSLQLNYGTTPDGLPHFGDISRMTGTALTDWSWGPLFIDMDNDGHKDLFVTNGTRRDINNKDYFAQLSPKLDTSEFLPAVQQMPAQKIPNYAFRNQGNLAFEDIGQTWGLAIPSYSNGGAYGDLDNDGDLDLVVNNIDEAAHILENRVSQGNWVRFSLEGSPHNPFGINAQVSIRTRAGGQFSELTQTRGFQSASEPVVHFGLGAVEQIEEVRVKWPDGKISTLHQIPVNQQLTISWGDAVEKNSFVSHHSPEPLFLKKDANFLSFVHQENEITDFEIESLLPHAISRFGPGLAGGDVNGDGLEDVFVGGAHQQAGAIFFQNPDGSGFTKLHTPDLEADRNHEDLGACFFDANQDGWLDLYVVSGGNEFEAGHPFYQDRLYLNHQGVLRKEPTALPEIRTSGSKVSACDIDKDGDLDLLVGGRQVPHAYGAPAKTTLLINESQNGELRLVDRTHLLAPELEEIGMVTDFVWADLKGKGEETLVLVGEWMKVRFFENHEGKLTDVTDIYNPKGKRGWWFSVEASDLDQDGREDLILGNLGTNYKYQASEDEPFSLYVRDFDENGQRDLILGYYNEGIQFPVRGRQCTSEQIPEIKARFKGYEEFARANLSDIYSSAALADADIHYDATDFASAIWLTKGDSFRRHSLPPICQVSSIHDILVQDINGDGFQDLVTIGNLFASEIETKRNDASIGACLLGNGKGDFLPLPYDSSGLRVAGDAKAVLSLPGQDGHLLWVAQNNGPVQVYQFNHSSKTDKLLQ